MAWETPLNLLRLEVIQRRDEGCSIPDGLLARIDALDGATQAYDVRAVDPLYDELMALPAAKALAADEPSELEAIRALRPAGPRDLGYRPSDAEALDKLHGAWTGRAVGCALGKPVEGMGMTRDGASRVVGRGLIKQYLENRGEWPLTDYFSGRDVGDGMSLWCPRSQREHISYMEADDDIHYTLVGLGVLETAGPGFDWQDVARYWLGHIPIFAICTAEAQAIQTVQLWSTRPGYWTCHATPALTRRHRNPYREWIGAQIRADGWAWACAGKPELAAEFAYRDACWTHDRNGIYGEMMFAAMQAAAFVVKDARELVEIGLSEIPKGSRLARWTRRCLEWTKSCADFEACMAKLDASLPNMHPIHTINNAMICVLSLVYGEMDTTGAPTTAVMCGHDTDCNGATVGSIVGAARGYSAFGGNLASRLSDTVKPNMVGFQEVSMRELAERTLRQLRAVDAYAAGR
ncbi:MAG: ADP-ribosylglycohydrolase family protein [Polyangiaceae bacterium]